MLNIICFFLDKNFFLYFYADENTIFFKFI